MTTTLETALTLHHQGISVVPVNTDGTKRPLGQWKHYQTSRATQEEIRRWYSTGDLGVGIVTGTISGHLEMLEVEGRASHRVLELKDLADASGLAALWDRVTAGWFELSPSGGYHWLYRVAWTPDHGKFPGNTKLAQAATRETTAETRGEAGFVVVAPSAGTVHPTGKPWTLLKGGPATIPTITPAEREQLHLIFGTLNEYEPHQAEQPSILDQALTSTPTGSSSDGVKPGDDYEAKTDWADILTPAGWSLVFTRGRTRYWRRPGKTDPGFSATTGRAEDRDRLWVFTTSTEFQHETPYTKFGAYALLHHGGDHTAAARALKTDGFGSEPTRNVTALPSTAKRAENIPGNMPATSGSSALATVHELDERRTTDTPRVALTRSDDGNALALIDEHGNTLRYCAERGRWLAWNGHVWQWQPTGGGIARERAKDIARALPSDSEAAVNHKRRALSAKGTSDMLVQASTDPRVTVSIDDLDAHPWELNTPGGIINLRTGTLQPSDPARLHTRSTSCTPDFEADLTLWLSFLHTTFAADQNLISYMQRLFGYSAVGEVREHLLPFGYGSGGNGKGVAMETIAEILGDYATSSPNGFLMSSNYAQHSTEIARLAGTRFVICSEVNESDRFDEAKVKLLTGGDRLTARFMRQDDFTFRPTHHLWLVGNYQPPVESGGDSFWRRLRLIPFTHTVPDEQRIEDLQGILGRDHGPAVLAWLAQGAALYANTGLQEPAGVKAATRDYAHSVDTVGRFLEEECTIYPHADTNSPSTTVSALRGAYEKWCSDNGEDALRGRSFASSLQRHGVLTGMQAPRATHGSGRLYGGVMLHSLQPDALDAFDGDRGGY